MLGCSDRRCFARTISCREIACKNTQRSSSSHRPAPRSSHGIFGVSERVHHNQTLRKPSLARLRSCAITEAQRGTGTSCSARQFTEGIQCNLLEVTSSVALAIDNNLTRLTFLYVIVFMFKSWLIITEELPHGVEAWIRASNERPAYYLLVGSCP